MLRRRMVKVSKLIAKSPWIPNRPEGKQRHFLSLLDEREAFYGGAAGGGKTDALLMAALMYADVPGYNAILFRRTYPELAQADGLIPRSKEWLGPTPAKWSEGRSEWTFPSGASLRFGHMQREPDKYNYQGGAYQFIGFDELTGFTDSQYRYLLSRLRRLKTSPVPLRQRGASNPGNEGHHWVYERFVVGDKPFIPANLNDNPYLSADEYRENLQELDDVTRAQLLEGKWVVAGREKPFRREFWRGRNRYDWTDSKISTRIPPDSRWIAWDTAATDKEESAYTAYIVGEIDVDYTLNIREVWRGRPEFPELPDVIRTVAERWNYDRKLRSVVVENASSGIQAYQVLMATAPEWLRNKLSPAKPLGKEHGWAQAGVWAKRGMIRLPQPIPEVTQWLYPFEEELYRVPDGSYFDQADAFAILVNRAKHYLAEGFRAKGMAA